MHYKVKKRSGQAGWALKCYVGPGQEKYVPKEAWPAGLRQEMTVEEARAYVKSLNASTRISAEERSRQASSRRLRARRSIQHALLPEQAVLQFERIYFGSLPPGPKREKREGIWAIAQQLIADTGLNPSDWLIAPDVIYAWFPLHGYSYDYTKRIVSALNKYGHLYSRLMGHSFYPIGHPSSEQKVMIDEAQETDLKSEPLSIAGLQALQRSLPVHAAAWVTIAFWFGLRPHEADQVVAPAKGSAAGHPEWWIEGRTLVIYQPKLRGRPPLERYKRVPIERREQLEALKALRVLQPLRPTRTQVKDLFPPDCSLYACRHGFTVFMDSLSIPRETISRWLGHSSLSTTERYYLRLGRHVRRMKTPAGSRAAG